MLTLLQKDAAGSMDIRPESGGFSGLCRRRVPVKPERTDKSDEHFSSSLHPAAQRNICASLHNKSNADFLNEAKHDRFTPQEVP